MCHIYETYSFLLTWSVIQELRRPGSEEGKVIVRPGDSFIWKDWWAGRGLQITPYFNFDLNECDPVKIAKGMFEKNLWVEINILEDIL